MIMPYTYQLKFRLAVQDVTIFYDPIDKLFYVFFGIYFPTNQMSWENIT